MSELCRDVREHQGMTYYCSKQKGHDGPHSCDVDVVWVWDDKGLRRVVTPKAIVEQPEAEPIEVGEVVWSDGWR